MSYADGYYTAGDIELSVANPSPAWVHIKFWPGERREVRISLHPSEFLDLEYLVDRAKRQLESMEGEI